MFEKNWIDNTIALPSNVFNYQAHARSILKIVGEPRPGSRVKCKVATYL
jgi:hypothetical protein